MSFERLNELFDGACEVPASGRRAFLEAACDDPALVEEVLALFAAEDDAPEGFLALSAELRLPSAPKQLGPYRVVGELGRGGMGIVYEAMQDHPQRRVAVKVLRARFGAERMDQRFEREARVLGQLQHPGIAHIYEAGTANIGGEACPYLVMELVRGRPLDAHFDAFDVPLEARLALVAEVCDAVEHAHQRGVIHRDLKPSNILVTTSDGPSLGRAKILDFGIARVVGVEAFDSTLCTETGEVIGTVGYMSPEQLAGRLDAIDARTDVYALGVILYVVASGQMPYDVRHKPLTEVVRMVADDDPTPLSSVDRALRGDLETIVSKALEREPERRYASAAALARDLRAFLAHEPIVARAPTAWYRLTKFSRRNKGLAAGIAMTFTALVVALVVSSVALVRANRDREASEAVTGFLVEMMSAPSPAERGRDVTMRELLAAAEPDLDARFAEQPIVRARLHETLGRAYVELGDFDRALAHAKRTREVWESEFGPDDPRTLAALAEVATAHFLTGGFEAAREALQRAIAGYRRARSPDAIAVARALSLLGEVETKLLRFDRAEALLVEARRVFAEHGLTETRDGVEADARLAHVYAYLRRDAEAERIQKLVIERTRRLFGDRHPNTIQATVDLGSYYNLSARGIDIAGTPRSLEVVRILEEAYALQKEVLGELHASTLATLNELAQAQWRADNRARAIELTRAGFESAREAYGDLNPVTLDLRIALAECLRDSGALDEARALLDPGYELYEKVYGPMDRPAMIARKHLVYVYVAMEEFEEARRHGEILLERNAQLDWLPPWPHFDVRRLVGEAYRGLGRIEDAEEMFLSAAEAMPDYPDWFNTNMAEFYASQGREREAAEWRAKARTATTASRRP